MLFAPVDVVTWFFLVIAPHEVTNTHIIVFAMIEGSILFVTTKVVR